MSTGLQTSKCDNIICLLFLLVINWVFHDRRFCQIIWQIFTQGRAKKICQKLPHWGLKPGPPDHEANALPTELSLHSVTSLNLHGLYKVMLYWFSPTCEVIHETNQAHLRNLLPNRFLPSSLAPWSRGPGFNPHWGQFLTIFFALPCIKICQIIWQKRLSWKTQMQCTYSRFSKNYISWHFCQLWPSKFDDLYNMDLNQFLQMRNRDYGTNNIKSHK